MNSLGPWKRPALPPRQGERDDCGRVAKNAIRKGFGRTLRRLLYNGNMMAKYSKDFMRCCPQPKRKDFQTKLRLRQAYLERAPDGSQYMIVLDPAGMDEAMFACLEDGTVTCVGNRVRG